MRLEHENELKIMKLQRVENKKATIGFYLKVAAFRVVPTAKTKRRIIYIMLNFIYSIYIKALRA
jgi:hypothetical protein